MAALKLDWEYNGQADFDANKMKRLLGLIPIILMEFQVRLSSENLPAQRFQVCRENVHHMNKSPSFMKIGSLCF